MRYRPKFVFPALCLATGLSATLVHAQEETSSAVVDAGVQAQVRQLALEGSQAGAGAPRVEVTIGQLDPRLRLAPCQRIDPYVPEGMRLWGKSRIGLRCTQGTIKWNVYLPITVQVFGQALVAKGKLAAGSTVSADDLTIAEVDLAEDASPAVTHPETAVGRQLQRSLNPGQSLRASNLRSRQWFNAGDTVTIVAKGSGFSVSSEGQALAAGIEGQSVRVRTEGGRVVSGQAVGDRRVEMPL